MCARRYRSWGLDLVIRSRLEPEAIGLRHDGARAHRKTSARTVTEEKPERLADRSECQVVPGNIMLSEQADILAFRPGPEIQVL